VVIFFPVQDEGDHFVSSESTIPILQSKTRV